MMDEKLKRGITSFVKIFISSSLPLFLILNCSAGKGASDGKKIQIS